MAQIDNMAISGDIGKGAAPMLDLNLDHLMAKVGILLISKEKASSNGIYFTTIRLMLTALGKLTLKSFASCVRQVKIPNQQQEMEVITSKHFLKLTIKDTLLVGHHRNLSTQCNKLLKVIAQATLGDSAHQTRFPTRLVQFNRLDFGFLALF